MNRPTVAPIAFLVALSAVAVAAHEIRPAYLQMRQTAADTYEITWKVPARGEGMRLDLEVELPEQCASAPRRSEASAESHTERWTATCPGSLTGQTIRIDGLAGTLTDVLVRIERLDGTNQIARLTPVAASLVVEASPSVWQVAWTYTRLGIEHILLGVDHLSFALVLLILVKGARRLIATITAFTVAHSITLAGAALGFVNVPTPPVEACIALSIMFVAAEIVHERRGRPGVTSRRPWAVAFAFGLLHGFGFAGALTDVGLPQNAIPVALLFFNIGVEIAQVAFIVTVLQIIAAARRIRITPPAWAWRIPPYGIGSLAAYWFFERLAKF